MNFSHECIVCWNCYLVKRVLLGYMKWVGGGITKVSEKKRVLKVQLNEPSFEMVGVAC